MITQLFCEICREYFWTDVDVDTSEIRHEKCGRLISNPSLDSSDDFETADIEDESDEMDEVGEIEEEEIVTIAPLQISSVPPAAKEIRRSPSGSTGKPLVKKKTAKKAIARKVAVKKSAAKKIVAKKAATKKAAAKKTVARKAGSVGARGTAKSKKSKVVSRKSSRRIVIKKAKGGKKPVKKRGRK